mgnify:CR=1 FL=1
MKNITKFIYVAFLATSSFVFGQQNKGATPIATVAETKMLFWDLPHLKEAFISISPTNKSDGYEVGELGVNGGNKDMIIKFAQELGNNKLGKYDSFLISHKGKFLFESYYKRGRINLPHIQFSATKAYTSLAIGRAIQLGYLTMADLEQPLTKFLTDLDPTKFVEGVDKITLHQALTMSSGLRFSNEQISKFRKNPEQYKGIDQIQAFLSLSKPITKNSQSYKYQGADPIMVMQVLDEVVPGSAKKFIKNEIFDKLGINNFTWRDDLSGLPIADSGASITSRDMLKIGTLVLKNGEWKGKQLLSTKYLAKATSRITQPNEDWQPKTFSYGYLWYQTNLIIKNKNYDINIAWGAGGNRIILSEELDLVVVITGHDGEDTLMNQISEFVLPAFVK